MQPDRIHQIERLITAADFAAALKVSTRTLSRLRARGQVPAPVTVGGILRWRACDVRDYVDRLAPRPSGGVEKE